MSVQPTGRAGTVEIAPGLRIPKRFVAKWTDEELPYDIELVAVLDGAEMAVEKLTATRRPGGDRVTSEGLRAIPTARLLRYAVSHVVGGAPGSSFIGYLDELEPDEVDETELRAHTVAYVYQCSVLMGEPATQAVARTFKVSRATAGRLVADARERGLLGPALEGRAGEGRG